MLTKTKIALAAALLLGVASAAQAGDDNAASGGFRVGPLGQSATSGVNPVDHRSLARGAFASANVPVEAPRIAKGATWAPASESYIAIQDQFYRDSQ
jgi:hypothetical protein